MQPHGRNESNSLNAVDPLCAAESMRRTIAGAAVILRIAANALQIFPNEEALVRPVGALLHEQNDEWAVSRRYMSLETMAGLSDDAGVGTPAIAAAAQSGQQ